MFEYIYPSINSKNFEYKTFERKEFHDLKLTSETNIKQALKYQKFISRFLSSKTPYDKLFLFHKMGTGKTRTSIRVIEELQSSKQFRKYIILTPNTLLSVNYRNEIILASPEKYDISQEEKQGKSPAQIKKALFANINKTYQLDTFASFVKKIKYSTDDKLRQVYSNCVFVIDEVHNLITDGQYKLPAPAAGEFINNIKNKTYKEIFRALHAAENSKILLMSGTPLRDKPYQIADIMNLILPLADLLPVDNNFITRYLDKESDDTYSFKKSKTKEFERQTSGLVSYLKSPIDPNVTLDFVGEEIDVKFNQDIRGDIVYFSNMKPFQQQAYNNAYSIDTNEHISFYTNSTQASLFVFPDGSWGDAGFKKYIIEKKNMAGASIFKFHPTFLSEFRGKNQEEKILHLEKYSTKYAIALRGILSCPGKCFVFSRIVHGSGLIVFSLLLELICGFTRLSSARGDLDRQLRYVFFSSTVEPSTTKTQGLLKIVNDIKNVRGRNVKVILGSESISEGVTIKDVLRMDKLNPDWNEITTEQSIARIYRLNSHQNILKKMGKITLPIYKHCCIKTEIHPSIEEYMYIISQRKNISNKRIEYILKKNAMDCALFYDKNIVRGRDYSQECDYSLCSYSCAGMDGVDKPYDEDIKLNTVTYYKYWAAEDLERNIVEIRNIFQEKFIEDFAAASPAQFAALKFIVDNRVILYNKYGFQSFLNEYNNYYYLSRELDHQPPINLWYEENKISILTTSARDLLFDLCVDKLKFVVKSFSEFTIEQLNNIFAAFPNYVNQIIIENVILSIYNKNMSNLNFKKYILAHFRKSIIETKKKIIVNYDSFRCFQNGKWADCKPEERIIIQEKRLEEEKEIIELARDYGIYGIKKAEKFYIRQQEIQAENDKRRQPRGQVCTTIKKPRLLEFVNILGIEYPATFMAAATPIELAAAVKKSKLDMVAGAGAAEDDQRRMLYFSKLTIKVLCQIIEKWFVSNKLITIES